jgi:hypothetical protein
MAGTQALVGLAALVGAALFGRRSRVGALTGYYEDDEPDFAEPGGRSALRAARKGNPRNRSCPNCKARNVLTPEDVARGYQCDRCADATERGGEY